MTHYGFVTPLLDNSLINEQRFPKRKDATKGKDEKNESNGPVTSSNFWQ